MKEGLVDRDDFTVRLDESTSLATDNFSHGPNLLTIYLATLSDKIFCLVGRKHAQNAATCLSGVPLHDLEVRQVVNLQMHFVNHRKCINNKVNFFELCRG